MHIGLYTECLTRPHTGVEFQTLALIEGFKKAGHELTCFHFSDPRHPDLKNVNHYVFREPLPLPFYHRFASLLHYSCFNNLDVLHIQHPQLPYFKKPKVPVVLTIHDITPLLFPKFHNWKRIVFFKYFLPRYLRECDAIIVSSNSTKADLIRHYKIPEEKMRVVHLALTQKISSPVKKEQFILFLGTLEPRKNVEGLVKAFAIAKSRGLRHKLVIAGKKGWSYQNIFRLIKKLNLQNDVVYKGYVSEEEKINLYKKAALFVWPSFYEGFGLPVLEAMAHGTPVIASNVSSLPEVVGSAGILVNPYDVDEISNAILEVLSSTRKYKDMQGKGYKRAGFFTLDRMIKGTIGVYEGVK